MNSIEGHLVQLDALSASDKGAFPYAGCKRLHGVDERYAALVPDLDAYLSEMAGYRSWGKRITTWSDEKVARAERGLRRSFVERNPAYVELLSKITEVGADDVQRSLDVAERTRVVLLELLAELRKSRPTVTS